MQAVSKEGGKDFMIDEIVITTHGDEPAAPCGGCRQMLVEFGVDFTVHSVNKKGDRWSMTMDELLPRSFGPCSFTMKPKN